MSSSKNNSIKNFKKLLKIANKIYIEKCLTEKFIQTYKVWHELSDNSYFVLKVKQLVDIYPILLPSLNILIRIALSFRIASSSGSEF